MEIIGTPIYSNTLGDLPYNNNKCYLWYDGPKMWESHDLERNPLLFYWVMEEKDEQGIYTDRFMIIPTTSRLIRSLINNKITIQDFVRESSQIIYIQDMRKEEFVLYQTTLDKIPEKYLAKEGKKLYEE